MAIGHFIQREKFAIDVVYGIDGGYDDLIACASIVVTYMKDFSGGLKDAILKQLATLGYLFLLL